jgi:uncharacterized short protein YbdD (DUF466 family)
MTRKETHKLDGYFPNLAFGAAFYKALLDHPKTTRPDLPPMPEWATRGEIVDNCLTFYGGES